MYIGLYKTPNKALSCLLSCKQKKLSSFKSPDEGLPIPCTEMSSILYNVFKTSFFASKNLEFTNV